MTVNELKQALNSYPDSARVVVDGYEEGYDDPSLILAPVVFRDGFKEKPWYVGQHMDPSGSPNETVTEALIIKRPYKNW